MKFPITTTAKLNGYLKTLSKLTVTMSLFSAFYSIANDQADANTKQGEETEKKVEKIRVLGNRDAGIELSSEKILKVPGAGNDPIRAVESLPGVVLANGFAPAVRGSSPNDMYYQTDDVPVGNVFHNDAASTFHPNLIQSFELKTGAWESSFTDAIGGVIATKLKEPEFTEPNTIVDLSFLRASFLFESALSEDSAFYVAVRQSLVHLYIENLLDSEDFQFTQAPINNDYQFKFLHNIDSNNKIIVQATGSNDDVGLLFSDDSTEVKQNPDLKGGIGVGQFYHNQSVIWTNYSKYGESKLIVNRLERNADLQIGQILKLDALTTDYMIKGVNVYDTELGELTSGIDLRTQNVDYQVTGKRQPCNPEFEICPPSYFSPVSFEKNNLDINFVNLFVDYDWDIYQDWTLKLGGAYNYNSHNEQTFIEPRVAAKWQLNDDYMLKLAYGQHHQWFRQYKYLSETFGQIDLDQVKADHYVVGLQFEGESDWAWRVEAYYKDMDDLIVSNPDQQYTNEQSPTNNGSANYLNQGVGEAYGIELLINKALSNKWYGWLSLAYSKTKRINQLTDTSFSYEFDLPVIVNLVSNYEISENWEFGARWRYQSGALYTPIIGADPVFSPQQPEQIAFYDPIEGDFNSDRLESFHRLDVRFDYQTKWWGNDTSLYFEVLNLYGQKSVAGFDYNEDYSEKEPSYQFPESALPSIGIQITF